MKPSISAVLFLWLRCTAWNLVVFLVLLNITYGLASESTGPSSPEFEDDRHSPYPESNIFHGYLFSHLDPPISIDVSYSSEPFFYECICRVSAIDECFLRANYTSKTASYFTVADNVKQGHVRTALGKPVGDWEPALDRWGLDPALLDDKLSSMFGTMTAVGNALAASQADQLTVLNEQIRHTFSELMPSALTSKNQSPTDASIPKSRTRVTAHLHTTITVTLTVVKQQPSATLSATYSTIPDLNDDMSAGGIVAIILSVICILLTVLPLVHLLKGADRTHTESEMVHSHPLHTISRDFQADKDAIVSSGNAHITDQIKDKGGHSPSRTMPSIDSGEPVCRDNRRIIRFTRHNATTRPKFGDWLKAVVEVYLRHPVIWWPLKSRNIQCSKSDMRLSWYCGCTEELYVDLPQAVAVKYFEQCAQLPLSFGSPTVLPIHNPSSTILSSSTSTEAWNIRTSSSNISQRFSYNNIQTNSNDPKIRDAQQANLISEISQNRFLHWCVDISKFETRLFHIPVPRLNDITVISALKSAYNAAGGFRRWFSLTACYGVRFVMFERVHRSREIIACGKEGLPCRKTNQDYVYTFVDPEEQFIKTLERSLMHHLHNPYGCGAQDIEDVLTRIPKKTNGKLEMRFGAAGYGMYAVPGWAFWKLLVALFLTQIGPLIFAIRWLCGHPGDLQNAFILSFYLVGLLNLVVVLPDIWSMHR